MNPTALLWFLIGFTFGMSLALFGMAHHLWINAKSKNE
jgi:hypothetical protein